MTAVESTSGISLSQYSFVPRCVRHITSIQIRNLTPFPVRDTFTSALSKPIETHNLNSGGQFPYVDVASPKKRLRKLSSNSTAAHSGRRDRTHYEDELNPPPSERKIRPRSHSSHSRLNTVERQLNDSDEHNTLLPSSSPPSFIPRPRTTSTISSVSSRFSEFSKGASPYSALLPDTSQSCLESIVSSRLTETFLAINFPSSSHFERSPPHQNEHKPNVANIEARETSRRSIYLSHQGRRLRKTPDSFSSGRVSTLEDDFPDYLSPIHIPSTNPFFPLNARSGQDFSPWIDVNGSTLNIKLWGRRHSVGPQSVGIDKSTYRADTDWTVLRSWNVDLSELRELPENYADCSNLPANSLLITLCPPGLTFYYPDPGFAVSHSAMHTRGYTSDPESRSSGKYLLESDTSALISTSIYERRGHEDELDAVHGRAKTASWQDIFKLVSAQSCVMDTKKSLCGVVNEVGIQLQNDVKFLLRRDISLRETRIQELKLNIFEVLEISSMSKTQLQSRTTLLQQRRNLLELVKKQVSNVQDSANVVEQRISDQRHGLISLRSKFAPLRVSLITILSNIFPIDLSSPPDLLYTIINAPLPIPAGPTDPAPPLILPEHKDVNEDSIATALGYVAQVLRLISIYITRDLVYPVTCIGSRSLIRDDISAMVGPRMFPLFSMGVDTYRFEYGVFLLNKNIEILMTERDLRALDMRHTLPNLKNLLLTLSHGQGATLPMMLNPGSPLLNSQDMNNNSQSDVATPLRTVEETSAGPHSGSTTPTTPMASGSGKLKLLGLGPFTDFIRSRPLSTRAFSNASKLVSSAAQEEGSTTELDEDQKTIHGYPREVDDDSNQVVQD